MDSVEKYRVQQFHQRRLGGEDHQALGYRSQENQQLRFEILCQWGDLCGLTIMDLGCGLGNLKGYLDQHYDDFTYLGVDFLPDFIHQAQKRYRNKPRTHFLTADFLNIVLPKVDIVIASGSLNYRSQNPFHPWRCINKMWRAGAKGIAFNLLDAQHFHSGELLCGYDKAQVLNYCQDLDLQTRVVDGYLPDDMTFLLRR